jgi:hypothetical protein
MRCIEPNHGLPSRSEPYRGRRRDSARANAGQELHTDEPVIDVRVPATRAGGTEGSRYTAVQATSSPVWASMRW